MQNRYIIQVFIASTVLIVVFSLYLFFYMLHSRKQKNEFYLEKQRLKDAIIQEGERMLQQVSKEIHDNFGQELSLVVMSLHMIERLAADTEQLQLIQNTCRRTKQIVDDVQHVGHSLNSDFIKSQDLVSMLERDLEYIQAGRKITYSLNYQGEVRELEPDTKLLVYRIAQEALHNIIKHAEASHIDVSVSHDKNIFYMTIKDNGIGSERKELCMANGIGIRNMQQRAESLGGTLKITSEKDCGTQVALIVPMENKMVKIGTEY